MAETPNPNPSPKEQFLGNKARIEKHLTLIGMPQFQDSVNMALLELQKRVIGNLNNANDAAAAALQLRGAQEFVGIFTNLGFAIRKPAVVEPLKLDHSA